MDAEPAVTGPGSGGEDLGSGPRTGQGGRGTRRRMEHAAAPAPSPPQGVTFVVGGTERNRKFTDRQGFALCETGGWGGDTDRRLYGIKFLPCANPCGSLVRMIAFLTRS